MLVAAITSHIDNRPELSLHMANIVGEPYGCWALLAILMERYQFLLYSLAFVNTILTPWFYWLEASI
jgi:hypothetical protein